MINFNFGKKNASIKNILILTLCVSTFASCAKIDEKHVWDLVYEFIVQYMPNSPFLPELQKDPDIIERKVKRTVDSAIDDYWRRSGLSKAEVTKPRYMDLKNDETLCYTDECKALAPPMRICSPWVDICPKN